MPIPIASGNGEQVDPGTYAGRLYRIIDLGDQESTFNSETNIMRKVLFTFELIGELMSDGRPFMISRTYSASLHKKSALRRDLEAWFGRPISREDELSFDLHSLLDRPAMVTVTETEKREAQDQRIIGTGKRHDSPEGRQSQHVLQSGSDGIQRRNVQEDP